MYNDFSRLTKWKSVSQEVNSGHLEATFNDHIIRLLSLERVHTPKNKTKIHSIAETRLELLKSANAILTIKWAFPASRQNRYKNKSMCNIQKKKKRSNFLSEESLRERARSNLVYSNCK